MPSSRSLRSGSAPGRAPRRGQLQVRSVRAGARPACRGRGSSRPPGGPPARPRGLVVRAAAAAQPGQRDQRVRELQPPPAPAGQHDGPPQAAPAAARSPCSSSSLPRASTAADVADASAMRPPAMWRSASAVMASASSASPCPRRTRARCPRPMARGMDHSSPGSAQPVPQRRLRGRRVAAERQRQAQVDVRDCPARPGHLRRDGESAASGRGGPRGVTGHQGPDLPRQGDLGS